MEIFQPVSTFRAMEEAGVQWDLGLQLMVTDWGTIEEEERAYIERHAKDFVACVTLPHLPALAEGRTGCVQCGGNPYKKMHAFVEPRNTADWVDLCKDHWDGLTIPRVRATRMPPDRREDGNVAHTSGHPKKGGS